MTREVVQATPRGAMTPARRLRIYLACNGRCVCGKKVPMAGTVIDHPVTLWMGGPDEDHLLRYLCAECDRKKTAKDQGDIAKVKRIIRQADPETRKAKRPIKSRGFDKTLRKTFSGKVEKR